MGQEKALLLIGGIFPEEELAQIETLSAGQIQYAANELQNRLAEGFRQTFPGQVEILTEPFLGGYPRHYGKCMLPRLHFTHASGIPGVQLPFCNLSGFNLVSRYAAYRKGIRQWLQKNQGKECFLVCYSIQIYFMWLVDWLKRCYPSVHVHIVIPDLPAFMSMGTKQHSLRGALKAYHIRLSQKKLPLFDTCTVLTKQMAEALGLDSDRYTVVEGIARNAPEEKETGPKRTSSPVILYTGTLTRKYGVMDLVAAFEQIPDSDFTLVICGEGQTRAEIQKMAEKDPRIRYLGQIPHDRITELQRSATVLVNPRTNHEQFTRYSFPSKMMEYLASGTPVLCHRLDGFPAEYDRFFHYFSGEDPKSMAEDLLRICRRHAEENESEGERNRRFVQEEKGPVPQTVKIVNLLLNEKR